MQRTDKVLIFQQLGKEARFHAACKPDVTRRTACRVDSARIAPMFSSPPDANPSANDAVPVSELIRRARQTLERGFPLQWIVGEVSSLTRAASGHLYFTLRDESAQVRCVMYRSRAQLVPFRLAEGQRVEVRALAFRQPEIGRAHV